MGGLAIKNAYTRRYSKKEYEEIVPEIIEKAKTLFTDARDTRYYFRKGSATVNLIYNRNKDFFSYDLIDLIKINHYSYSYKIGSCDIETMLNEDKWYHKNAFDENWI